MLQITVSIDCQHDRWYSYKKHSFVPAIFLLAFDSISVRLESENERGRRKKRGKEASFTWSRFAYIRKSKLSPFIRELEGVGWSGESGVAGQLRRSGRVARRGQRRTVVFHSHYRNVLPCALVAPRNKSSVTVTIVVGGVAGHGRGTSTRGLLWHLDPPPYRCVSANLPFATIARDLLFDPLRSLPLLHLFQREFLNFE